MWLSVAGGLIIKDELFVLGRVAVNKASGSLKVCFWTVWPFEKFVDFGSVQWSEAFAGHRKMFVTCLVDSIGY